MYSEFQKEFAAIIRTFLDENFPSLTIETCDDGQIRINGPNSTFSAAHGKAVVVIYIQSLRYLYVRCEGIEYWDLWKMDINSPEYFDKLKKAINFGIKVITWPRGQYEKA